MELLRELQAVHRSLLSRGAWIEISRCDKISIRPLRRSSHEERGLKYPTMCILQRLQSRSSHEERGLKYKLVLEPDDFDSRSSHEERGLKLRRLVRQRLYLVSLLSRGAWIEIVSSHVLASSQDVAPLTRSVD